MVRSFKVRYIALELLVDVEETGRRGYSPSNAETESVCLGGAVVRVLSEYDYSHILNVTVSAPREHILRGRVDRNPATLPLYELHQPEEVWLRQFLFQSRLPAGLHSRREERNFSLPESLLPPQPDLFYLLRTGNVFCRIVLLSGRIVLGAERGLAGL